MYRGRQQQSAPVEEEDIGSDYSSDGGERFQTREPIENDAAAPALPTHLKQDMFNNVQKVWLDIDVMATPEQLASGQASTTWKLLPHLPGRHLKQNLALKDRHMVGDEHLAGDLRQCIPIEFEIAEHYNTFPFPIGIQAPGMMPRTLHRHGACLWRVQPNTPPTMVGAKAFEPTNVVDKRMYEDYSMCTLESLDADISIVPPTKGQKKGYGRIATNTVAYATLISNLDKGAWAAEVPHMDLDSIYSAPDRHQRSVEVTQKVAEDIRNTLRPIVQETIDRCVNLEDMNFEIVRADGNPSFNSPKGFIGELMGNDIDPKNKLTQNKLMTTCVFHIKGLFSFMLLGTD